MSAAGRRRSHRRAWTTLGVVVLAVALITGGPWVYAHVLAPAPAPPLALEEVEDAEPPPPPGPVDLEGRWEVGTGSEAGYRLEEVLSGVDVTVVGRTDRVSGTLEVVDGVLTSARVVVDAGAVVTDESARDAYYRRALDVSTYPDARFDLTEPVDVGSLAESTGAVPLDLVGEFTLRGVSRPAVAQVVARRAGDGFEVAGSLPITLEDHGLTAPDLAFVKVQPTGTVEMHLRVVR